MRQIQGIRVGDVPMQYRLSTPTVKTAKWLIGIWDIGHGLHEACNDIGSTGIDLNQRTAKLFGRLAQSAIRVSLVVGAQSWRQRSDCAKSP